MTSTGKRRSKKGSPKKGSPRKAKRSKPRKAKRVAPKRKQKAARAKPVPVPARTRTRTRTAKRAKAKRSAAAKKGWATRRQNAEIARKRAAREEREGIEWIGSGDEEVQTGSYDVDPDYVVYPVRASDQRRLDARDLEERDERIDAYVFERSEEGFLSLNLIRDLVDLGDRAMAVHGEIEWYPRFDEVYDYIDGLVEEFDLDAHSLFELAFGYSDEATA